MTFERRFIKNWAAICIAIMLIMSFTGCGASKNLAAGSSWEVTETTNLDKLTIGKGAAITAPKGFSLTMTVDGIEKPMAAGTYKGKIVITKAEENPIKFSETVTHPFRQALYLDGTGVVAAKSVTSAAGAYTYANGVLTGAVITSEGENFNGIYAAGGTQTVKGATINFTGNGGNDFAGYGAAIMSSGKDTTLIVDGANISTKGAVRTVALADKGSNLIIKNSTLAAKDGILPADYVSNVSPGDMKDVPWMLGLQGNCRATNLLGDNTTATYINDNLSAEGWGVLSVDNSQNSKVTAINSKISITGISGYGTYAIGNSTNSFYGCDIQVADYAAVNRGGLVIYGASTPETVAKLNSDLKLGLTEDEMKALPQTRTTINSKRFAVMWHGQGNVKVQDDTIINTKEAIFLDKGQTADINVDGSKGAQLNSENGIILQIIEDDDPGPVTVDGKMVNKGVYKEPATPPVKAKDFDVTAINKTDVTATFAGITLKGDFYNAVRGGSKAGADMSGQAGGMAAGAAGGATVGGPGGAPGAGGPGGAAGGGPGGAAGGAPGAGGPGAGGPGGGGMPGGAAASGKNMVLTFDKADVTGVISATTAKHAKDTITAEDYKLLGEVANTPSEAVNNGVIVTLTNSSWTVTGTSYLTSLTITEGSAVKAPEGSTLTMTVNGVKKPIAAGTYKGAITLAVSK